MFKIFGTGAGMSENVRDVVLDGDLVLCPCGKNGVIVGNNPGVFVHVRDGSGTRSASTAIESRSNVPATVTFDEQVRVTASVALEGYPYFIEFADGRTFGGRVDRGGKLTRIVTEEADEYTVHWGDEALARQEGA